MSMKNFLLWLTFFVLVMTGVSAADAQTQRKCGALAPTLDMLKKEHGETPLYNAKSKHGPAIIMTLNPKTGTYSVLGLGADGVRVCMLDEGGSFKPWTERRKPAEPKVAPKLKPTDGGRES